MAICNECAAAAEWKRDQFDNPPKFTSSLKHMRREHPKKCGCPCQHADPAEWESQFSGEQPGGQ